MGVELKDDAKNGCLSKTSNQKTSDGDTNHQETTTSSTTDPYLITIQAKSRTPADGTSSNDMEPSGNQEENAEQKRSPYTRSAISRNYVLSGEEASDKSTELAIPETTTTTTTTSSQIATTTNEVFDDLQPLPEAPSTNGRGMEQQQPQLPGAYSDSATSNRRLREKLRFSLVGQQQQQQKETTIEEPPLGTMNEEEEEQNIIVNNKSNDNNHPSNDSEIGLAQAILVHEKSVLDISMQPVDIESVEKREANFRKQRKCFLGLLFMALVIIVLGSIFGLRSRSSGSSSNNETSTTRPPTAILPTGSPTTRPLPLPIDNLELLYYDVLPQETRENLYNSDSPQYEAWMWLLKHPNVSEMKEWRKKQIFAMVSFFYSFDGPNWANKRIQSRWLNTSANECSWGLTDDEVDYNSLISAEYFGPDSYADHDWQTCNENGELQSLLLSHISPSNPVKIPPEIGFLTSLKHLEIFFSQITAKLSDLLVPELTQLPSLVYTGFQGSSVTGTIPAEVVGHLTNLRHLLLGETNLKGPIPVEIGKLTSLEYFTLYREGSMTKLPSEVGLMTKLSVLSIFSSSLSGRIPSEVGMMSGLRELYLGDNHLSGSLPKEICALSHMEVLSLPSNRLTGSTVPLEMSLMTGLRHLWIGYNAFTGAFPSEIARMTSLEHLVFDGMNGITGALPSELGLMTSLTGLEVARNSFSGLIPSELGLLSHSMWRLSLDGNMFSGSLPGSIWDFSHLDRLHLSDLPNLHGSIPTAVFMPNLTSLSLSGSPVLSGTIPEDICNVQELNFDCSDLLCGCGCHCNANANGTSP